MRLFIERVAVVILVFCMVMLDGVDVSAAGKTIGAYKCTKYGDKGSDAKTIYDGVKGKNYSGTYAYAGTKKITSADFYDKSKTIKYWSSHGLLSGNLYGNAKYDVDFTVKKDFTWAGGNLEFVFLAACNQLNKDGGPLKTYAKAMRGDKAVRVVCGYHSTAPDGGDNLVAKKFIEYAKTGESVKSSWIKANEYVAGLKNNQKDALAGNYAVLTHSGNAQYSRFPGFPGNTYERPNAESKKILRFRRKVENEVVLKAAKMNVNVLNDNNIEKEPIKFKVDSSCDDMVFNEGNKLSLDGGELEIHEIQISKNDIYKKVRNYLDENVINSSEIELDKKHMEIQPIVVDDACSDVKNDMIVAYSVSFPHMYEGEKVNSDNLIAIVDEKGVKYAAVNWSKINEGGE